MTPQAYKTFKKAHRAEIAQVRAEIKARKDAIKLKKQEIKEAKAKRGAYKQEQRTAKLSDAAKTSTATANRVNVKRIAKPVPTLFGFELTPWKKGAR